MSLLRDDATRARSVRRGRVSAAPVRVGGPLASGAAAVLLAIVLAGLLDLSAASVTIIALAVALASVVAVRRTLGSLAAGVAMRLARPYSAGELIRLYVPSRGSTMDADIVRVGAANTTLLIAGGLAVVANSWMLRMSPGSPR